MTSTSSPEVPSGTPALPAQLAPVAPPRCPASRRRPERDLDDESSATHIGTSVSAVSRLLAAALALSAVATSASAQTAAFRVELRAELEVRAPERPTDPLGPLPLVEEQLEVTVEGQYATSELTQVFENRTGQRVEGRYRLRPEPDATVQGFAYYIGEERIEGEVLERQAARRVYDQVTRARRDPAILEQSADGEYGFRVFPIEAGERKRVEIRFGEWLRRRGTSVTYRAPLHSAAAVVTLRDPRARLVRSPTHDVDVEAVGGGFRVRTRARHDDGAELVLRWEVEEAPFTPNVWVHQDEGHEGYFVMSVAAPEGYEDRVSAKDVTLVLDRSGSMAGAPIDSARRAASDIVRRLGADDRVNVIAFDDDASPLFSRPRPAHVETRADALQFIAQLSSGGGTDIAFALDRALSAQHDDDGGRPQVVIFLTDGQSPPAPALEVADRDRRDVRVFTVGVGEGVNRSLLSRLAAVKRGSFTWIAQADRLEAEVGHLYAQIARPLLVDVAIELDGGVISRTYPRTLPDLFVDDELVVAGRFRGDGPLRFRVRGRLGARDMELTTTASARATGPRGWVGRRWASGRVDHLLEQIQLEGERPELREEVVSLALAYDMVTPYTAFLAIPAREVTAEAAETLNAARGQRASAEARHADAMALRSAPAPDAPMEEAPMYAAGADDGEAEATYAMAPPGAAGCASCSVAAPRQAPLGIGLAVLVGLAVVVRRRWR